MTSSERLLALLLKDVMTDLGSNNARVRVPVEHTIEREVELSWYAISDVGKRRETNQDSYVVHPPIFSVADGMGGHSAGEVASQAVVKSLDALAKSEVVTREDLSAALSRAVDTIELETADADLGAGTTVTGVFLTAVDGEPVWETFNIGDSRVYQFFRGALTQVTTDHSVVQHLVASGQITAEEAEYHPHANVITRAVGFNEEPIPDFVPLAVVPGQRLLICSDGLTKELTELGLRHYLSAEFSTQEAAESLVREALNNAGRDNVTVIVLDVHAVGKDRDTSDLSHSVVDDAPEG